MKEAPYLVVGLGKTGHSIASYLRRRNKPFMVYDTRSAPEGTADFYSEFPGVDVFLGEFPPTLYAQLSGIICSPGVPLDSAFIKKAQESKVPVFGDIECLMQEVEAPIIAITGTNGKSTVTTLVGEMTKAAGKTVAVAGNIGLPVLDILDVGVTYDLWVLELSSFQLDLTHSLKPLAATVLNITPDHLDRHHTMDAYIHSKQHIYDNAKTIIYNREDKLTFPKDALKNVNTISFGLDKPNEKNWGLITNGIHQFIAYGNECLLSVEELHLKGKHNWLNVMSACALAMAAGVSTAHMIEVLKRFTGLPHRSQWVREIDGVAWINDSKGTNVGATVSAISGIGGSMQGKIVLIAGGQGKGADFSELRSPVLDYVRSVVLIGQDAKLIENALGSGVSVVHAPSLEMAVQLAKKEAKPGDVVLLSPACASFDMFRDFNHRGDDFVAAVNAL